MHFVSVNPATGRRLASYRGHSRTEIERRVARAAGAQRAWA
ncbi:MAG: hypothetical protein RLZZ15_58, partial [Verrucomicrobiota bacterium]